MFGSHIFYSLYISEKKQEKNFIFGHGYVKTHLAWKTLTLAFNFDCIVVKTNTTEIYTKKIRVYSTPQLLERRWDARFSGLWFLSAQAGGPRPRGLTWGPGWVMFQASKDSISNQLKSLELDKFSVDNNKRPLFL